MGEEVRNMFSSAKVTESFSSFVTACKHNLSDASDILGQVTCSRPPQGESSCNKDLRRRQSSPRSLSSLSFILRLVS